MSTSTHPVPTEEIMALLDAELSLSRAKFVSAHVSECAECRKVQDTLGSTLQSVAKWTVPDIPSGTERNVLGVSDTNLRSTQDGFLGSLRAFLRRRPLFAWGGIVSVLLILIGLSSTRYDRAPSHVPRAGVAYERVPEKGASLGTFEEEKKAPKGSQVASDRHSPRLEVSLGERGRNVMGALLGGVRGGIPVNGPMIARTLSLSIVVKDFDAGRASLDAILARYNGYAASLNVSTPQASGRTLEASLRIPAPQLVPALSELKALGRVEAETQNGEEVTQQHADLLARLKNSRETEQRLQDVLRTRTGKVKDVLEVEEEIARVRGEIEQMEVEQKTLEHRVEFATIDLKLAEEYKAQLNTPAPSVLMQLRNAAVNGFRNAFESFLALVLFLAESGPSLLLWLSLLGIPAWQLWKRYRRARTLAHLAGA
jgi:uncharacterized protein DUF4349